MPKETIWQISLKSQQGRKPLINLNNQTPLVSCMYIHSYCYNFNICYPQPIFKHMKLYTFMLCKSTGNY